MRSILVASNSLRKLTYKQYVTVKHPTPETKHSIAHLILDSAPVNSLGKDFFKRFLSAMDEIESNAEVTSLVLSSNLKVFSAGLDLKTLHGSTDDQLKEFWGLLQETLRRLYKTRLLTVAAINGPAIAGGCILTLCCDYRFISEKAVIGLNEAAFGLIPPPWADSAKTIGLVDEICASDVSVTEFSEKWIENQLKASKSDILGRSATKVANPLSYPAKHVNAHHFDPTGLYIHQAILVQPLDDLFFASDAVRQADIDLFVRRTNDPSTQKSLSKYLSALAAKSKK